MVSKALLVTGNFLLGLVGVGTTVAGTVAPTDSVWLKVALGLIGVITTLMVFIFGVLITHIINHNKGLVTKETCDANIKGIERMLDKLMKHFDICDG